MIEVLSISAPKPGSLSKTPELCGYSPVRKPARDGQQSGEETMLWLNEVPWSPIAAMVLGIVSSFI